VCASAFVRHTQVIPCHYNTFPAIEPDRQRPVASRSLPEAPNTRLCATPIVPITSRSLDVSTRPLEHAKR
jgi:hypothetical protein